jgi:hypothetical protein
MRKRENSRRVRQIQWTYFSFQLARRNAALDCGIGAVVCICNNSETEGLGCSGRELIDSDIRGLTQQRGELERAVYIKQYDLAPIVG